MRGTSPRTFRAPLGKYKYHLFLGYIAVSQADGPGAVRAARKLVELDEGKDEAARNNDGFLLLAFGYVLEDDPGLAKKSMEEYLGHKPDVAKLLKTLDKLFEQPLLVAMLGSVMESRQVLDRFFVARPSQLAGRAQDGGAFSSVPGALSRAPRIEYAIQKAVSRLHCKPCDGILDTGN